MNSTSSENEKKIGIRSFLAIYVWPLREAFGIAIQSIPFRLSELYMLVHVLLSLPRLKKIIIHKQLLFVLLLLLLNAILTMANSMHPEVDYLFLLKYLSRNFLIFFFLLSVIVLPYKLKPYLFRHLAIFTVLINLLFSIPNLFGYHILYFQLESYNLNELFYLVIFRGTASEPAYMIPILAFPLFYFGLTGDSKDIYWFLLCLITVILSFSSFGMAVIVFFFIIWAYGLINGQFKATYHMFILLAVTIIAGSLLIIKTMNYRSYEMLDYTKNKITGFLLGDATEYSSMARISNYQYCWDRIQIFSTTDLIFGKGTGSYAYLVGKSDNNTIEAANEAHNLYLSTIHDRGYIGLAIILAIFISVLFLKIKSDKYKYIIQIIRLTMIIQMLQWLLTGNFWIYYFWLSYAFLISIKIEEDGIAELIESNEITLKA